MQLLKAKDVGLNPYKSLVDKMFTTALKIIHASPSLQLLDLYYWVLVNQPGKLPCKLVFSFGRYANLLQKGFLSLHLFWFQTYSEIIRQNQSWLLFGKVLRYQIIEEIKTHLINDYNIPTEMKRNLIA